MEKVCSKTNRFVLMGVAIIAITICHINQFVGVHKDLHSELANEFLYASAAVGVDIFFFFSLVGLGFSLEKNKLITFYRHRINRIFPTYFLFILIVLFVFYKDFSLNEKCVLFAQQLFGFSATQWVSERIEWYVPSLIVLYTLYPLMFLIVRKIHKNTNNKAIELLILGATVLISYTLDRCFVGLFARRLPLYYLATLSFFYIREGKAEDLDIIYIIAACCSFIVKNEVLSYSLIIPLFLFVVNRDIDKWAEYKWAKFFSWLGHYTLEIYLAQVIATKYLIKVLPTSNIVLIVAAVIITTALLAFFLNRFHSFINNLSGYLKKEIGQAKNENRLTWVDAAKGLAMLIIMWGHVQHPSPLKMWLTSFHVPLFLVLSGILLSRKNKSVHLVTGGGKRLINKLLYPYTIFSVIAIICYSIYYYLFEGLHESCGMTALNIYKTITGYGILAIWFIPSYFIACALFYKILYFRNAILVVVMLLCALIGICGSFLFDYLHEVVSSTCFKLVYYPSASLLRGISCAFYMILGRLLFDIYKKIREWQMSSFLVIIIGLISLSLNLFLYRYQSGVNFSLLRLGSIPYICFINGGLGSIWVIVLFYSLRKIMSFPILQYVGRKSLIIMGTHMSLLLTIIVPSILGSIVTMPADETISSYLFGLGCVVIMLIIEIPVIKIYDSKVKWGNKMTIIKTLK